MDTNNPTPLASLWGHIYQNHKESSKIFLVGYHTYGVAMSLTYGVNV